MIILDTHAWIFWLDDPGRLGPGAIKAIESGDELGLSTFSCLEAGILIRKKKITVQPNPETWMESAVSVDGLNLLPMTSSIALEAALMEEFHADPADRVIVSTCQHYNVPLITRDRLISRNNLVETIW